MQLAHMPALGASAAERKAAVSCAVVAGIAAADAACCAALGERSSSQNHNDAATLLEEVEPDGAAAAGQLRRLLALKHEAQYGFGEASAQKLQRAQRAARRLLEFAERVVAR